MICRTVGLGFTITGAAVDINDRTHIFCRILDPDPCCPAAITLVNYVIMPIGSSPTSPAAGRPVLLHVAVPRFVCGTTDCPTVAFRADITTIAAPRAVMTRRTARWILQRIAIDKMSVTAVAEQLGISWKTVNTVAVESARALVYDGGHLAGVRHLGVDEHKWKHVRGQGDSGWVTVLIDLTPVVEGTGPARLLDMIVGRSKLILKT
jgi:transposase